MMDGMHRRGPGGLLDGLQQGVGGLLGGVQDWRQQNPGALTALGVGMMRGDMASGFEQAAQLRAGNAEEMRKRQAEQMAQMQEQQQAEQVKNATRPYLKSLGLPDEAIEAALINPEIMKLVMKPDAKAQTTALLQEYEAAKREGYEGDLIDFMTIGKGGGSFAKQPIYGRDEEGNVVIGQLGEDGTLVRTQTPEGFQPLSPFDLNADRSRGTAIGKIEGEEIAGAPAVIQMAQDIDSQVQSLKTDPYLPRMLGPIDSRLPNVSSDAARVQAKIDQLKGGAFLQARKMLKGGGQITDFESERAEAAFVRMNTAQKEEDFIAALDDFNAAVQAGARRLAQTPMAQTPRPGAGDNDPLGIRP